MKRKNILIKAVVSLTILLLFLSNILTVAKTEFTEKSVNNQSNESLFLEDKYDIGTNSGFMTIFDNAFNNTFSPDWNQNITNPSATWKIEDDKSLCHSKPYYAVCYNSSNSQDELIMTQNLDFSGYSIIKCSFFFMLDWWRASYKDYCDLNLCVSTNGGSDWDVVWSDDMYAHQSKEFKSWIWYDSDIGKHIDLSKYAGEKNVIIGFQYYSDAGSNGCHAYVDDLLIYVNDPSPNPVKCDANGPYEGKVTETIYFYGHATGGQSPYIYRWDFGDGSQYNYAKNPTHKFYDNITYNVSLRVIDTRFPDRRFDINYTNVIIKESSEGPPNLKIQNISGGFLIKATIKNDGRSNVSDIKWHIHARGLLVKTFDRKDNGTINVLIPGDSEEIKLKYYLGFGFMQIKITAVASGVEATPREILAIKIGPIFIIIGNRNINK